MRLLRRKQQDSRTQPKTDVPAGSVLATASRPGKAAFRTSEKISSMLRLSTADVRSGRYRTLLYRFLTDHIPTVDACIWTWSRLAAAPGTFTLGGDDVGQPDGRAAELLEDLSNRLYADSAGQPVGTGSFLVDLFTGLFRDGAFGGFLTVRKDASSVERFVPVDVADLRWQSEGSKRGLVLEHERGEYDLSRPDFRYVTLNAGVTAPLGRSVLRTVPFVAYIEQQMIDDMRRASHNSGFHRLHVKITPPERIAGESDKAYVERINSYFDSTVSMIKSCNVDDNPVTWDNVNIEYVGPHNRRSASDNWFYNHRAMIEEICAGTHLAPFLLGYSYGDTTTWSAFKFDVVMRQVRSVQAQASQLLEWIGNIELALAGHDVRCRFTFDNSFAYQASENAAVRSRRVDDILRLYDAGLLDKETARSRAGDLI